MDSQSSPNYESEMDWIFDPSPPSGAIRGGVPMAHVFRPDLDTFVREVIQNSLDQRKSESMKMKFIFEQFDGDEKEDFLNALQWHKLREHLDAASEAGFTTISPRLANGIQRVENNPIIILKIEDYGTLGLTGGESEQSKNFTALCKNILDTCEDKPLRGGSYGLGKAVLWSFSCLSTVLFSSYIDEQTNPNFRLFGRSELPYHKSGTQQWDGPGWYGKPEVFTSGQRRAVSAWNSDVKNIAQKIHLLRKNEQGSGTSILVVGFDEPTAEEARPLSEIAENITSSASRWFWPSLKEPDPKLTINVEVYVNGNEVYNQYVYIRNEESPFVFAMSSMEFTEKLDQPGDVSNSILSFRIPARKSMAGDVEEPERDTTLKLNVRQSGTEGSEHRNSVALIRGAGMVVKYHPVVVPLSDTKFHGVLLAGLANDDTEDHVAVEKFFRAAEPPSHREWSAATDRVRAEYRHGGQARLLNLWHDIDSAIINMCQELIPPSSEGPERLARMFSFGKKGGGWQGPANFRVLGIDAYLEEGIWYFSGIVIRNSEEKKSWEIGVSTWLAGETGKGDVIPISQLDADYGDIILDHAIGTILVPSNINRVTFNGETHAGEGEHSLILDDTRMRVEVRPHFRSKQ